MMKMNDWSDLVILNFLDITSLVNLMATNKKTLNDTKKYWRQLRHLFIPISSKNAPAEISLITIYCRNLRVIDTRHHVISVYILVALIRQSPLLEIYMGRSAHSCLLDVIYNQCPQIYALTLTSNYINFESLMKFKNLIALEIGTSAGPFESNGSEIIDLLLQNKQLQIVHILNYKNSFNVLSALNPARIRSLAFPYEHEPITLTKVKLLAPFKGLINLNFGMSSIIGAASILTLTKNHPKLMKFSFHAAPKPFALDILPTLAEDWFFPNLTTLGCRSKANNHAIVAERREINIHDYSEVPENTSRLWCFKPFDIHTLLKQFGAPHHTQW